MPQTYRTKPIVVEAIAFVDDTSAREILVWAGEVADAAGQIYESQVQYRDDHAYVILFMTAEATTIVNKGDVLVKYPGPVFKKVHPDVFKTDYDIVGETAKPVDMTNHDHKVRVHRDGKEPWCNLCGMNSLGLEPQARHQWGSPFNPDENHRDG